MLLHIHMYGGDMKKAALLLVVLTMAVSVRAAQAYDCSAFLGLWDVEIKDAAAGMSSKQPWLFDTATTEQATGMISGGDTVKATWSDAPQMYALGIGTPGTYEDLYVDLDGDTFTGQASLGDITLAITGVKNADSADYNDCRRFLGTWEVQWYELNPYVWSVKNATTDKATGKIVIPDNETDMTDNETFEISWDENMLMFLYSADDGELTHLILKDDSFTGDCYGTLINGTKQEEPEPEPGPDNETCPATQLLGKGSAQLDILRRFRDEVLSKSAAGRKLSRLYYAHARSITLRLSRNPLLSRSVENGLTFSVPVLRLMLAP